MKTILAILCASFLLSAASHADVFIYRGTFTVTADLVSGAPFPPGLNAYIIVDYDGAQYGSLLFGHIGGGKHFIMASASSYNFGTAPLAKGLTESFFISATATNTSATAFSNNALLFRGKNTNLLIRKTPSSTMVDRPNVLKGAGVQGSLNNNTGTFVEERLGLTFQGAATIKANNANQTIDQTLEALVAELTAKGFTPPSP